MIDFAELWRCETFALIRVNSRDSRAEKMLRLWRFNGSTPRKEDAAAWVAAATFYAALTL